MNKTSDTIKQSLNPLPAERTRARVRLRSAMRPPWIRVYALRLAMSFAAVTMFVSSQTLPTDLGYEVRKYFIEGFQHARAQSDNDELELEARQLLSRIDDEETAVTQEYEF